MGALLFELGALKVALSWLFRYFCIVDGRFFLGLKRANKLLETDEFLSVFRFNCKHSGEFFRVFVKPNLLGYPRLGIIASKKTARKAITRSYLKRVIRETFRLNQSLIGSVDVVVRVRCVYQRGLFSKVTTELCRLFVEASRCHR